MIVRALMLASALAAVPIPAAAEDLVWEPRQPLAVLVTGPKGTSLKTHASELLEAASEVLAKHTDLEAVAPESEEYLGRCAKDVRLSCWVQEIRRKDLLLETGRARPFDLDAHRAHLRATRTSYPRYFLAIAVQPYSDDREQLSAVMLDTDLALLAIEETRAKAGAREAIEDAIFARAAKTKLGFAKTSDPRSLRDYFADLFEELRSSFEGAGHWDPYGVIEIARAEPGTMVEIDGRAIGAVRSTPARIRGVPHGDHTIDLVGTSGRRASQTLRVEAMKTAIFTPVDLALDPGAGSGPSGRTVTMIGGISTAAIGAALIVLTAVTPRDLTYVETCVDGRCSAPAPDEFAGTCEVFGADPSCLSDSRGLLAAPLGYALVAAGGIAAGGAAIGEEDRFPWIAIAVGVAAGALAYGLSAALEPASPIR